MSEITTSRTIFSVISSLAIWGALALVVLVVALLLIGCSGSTIAGLARSRHVEAALIPVTAPGGDLDLLIVNRNTRITTEYYLSYSRPEGQGRTVVWERQLDGVTMGGAVLATADEAQVYLATGTRLEALARADGALRWETTGAGEAMSHCPHCIAVADDVVVLLTTEARWPGK
jgi:hypothetical protein